VEVQAVAVDAWVGKGLIHQMKNVCAGETTPGVIMRVILPLLELCFMGHMAQGYTLSPPSKGTTTPNFSQATCNPVNFSHLIGQRDRRFSAIGGFKTPVGAVGLNDAMEIQTLKPGKCSLTLDASRIIQGTQQTDFPPDATSTFSQQLAVCK
jgi:hypothetical protein